MMKASIPSHLNPRLAVGLVVLVAWGVLCGCQSTAVHGEAVPPRIYLESEPGEAGVTVTLPVSGAALVVRPQPVLTEYDVTAVRVGSDQWGRGVELTLRPAAAVALQRMSALHAGRRLVIMVRGQAVGVRVLDGSTPGDRLLVYLEQPDAELGGWAARLQRGALGGTSGAANKS